MKLFPAFLAVTLASASSPRLPGANQAGTGAQHEHMQRRNANQHDHVHTPQFSFGELFQLQKRFLDNFIFPENKAEALSINSSLLAPNVQGRVDITRTFDGQELNTEYLFGLFANLAAQQNNPNAFTLLGIPRAYEITHFAASQNIASASTRFNFSFPILNGLIVPVEIETWNIFNEHGQISQYDATFKWWQWTVDYVLQTAAAAQKMTLAQITVLAQQKLAASICSTSTTYCNATVTDARNLYKSTEECETYLTEDVRLGEAYELGRNTVLCRMVHQNMVPFRPAVHCPHIGPTGGGYCDDDKTYDQTVTQAYFTNYPFAHGGNLSG